MIIRSRFQTSSSGHALHSPYGPFFFRQLNFLLLLLMKCWWFDLIGIFLVVLEYSSEVQNKVFVSRKRFPHLHYIILPKRILCPNKGSCRVVNIISKGNAMTSCFILLCCECSNEHKNVHTPWPPCYRSRHAAVVKESDLDSRCERERLGKSNKSS